MKNLILIFISVLLVGCESTGPKVTTDDEKSQAILSAYDGYLANEYGWAEELYSDDITVYINSVEALLIHLIEQSNLDWICVAECRLIR